MKRAWVIKILFLAILALFLLFIYANQTSRNVPLEELEQHITPVVDTERMALQEDRDLIRFLGIDPSTTDGYLYYKGTAALSVEEILIIRSSDKKALLACLDLVEERIANQKKTFDSYGPTQVSQLKSATIIYKDQYLFYGVGEDAKAAEEVFRNAI